MELEAENWRLRSTTLVRGVAVELEDEKWRLAMYSHEAGAGQSPTPQTHWMC